jgi:hypothetical protein
MLGRLVQIYFVIGGLALVSAGIALWSTVGGLGKRWEQDVNRSSAGVNKVARLPWPSNPYLGLTLRPAAGIWAIVVGVVLVGSVLQAAVH